MRRRVAWVFGAAACLALGGSAHSQPGAPVLPANQATGQADLLHRASIMGEDGRLTIEGFAKQFEMTPQEVRAMVSATGRMVCPAGRSTVQLVGTSADGPSRLVVAHAHSFYRRATCAHARIDRCEISFPYSSQPEKVYRIDMDSYQDGGRCPFVPDGKPVVGEQRFTFDWSVFELTEDVPGVQPYALPAPNSFPKSGATVLHVAAWSRNFRQAREYALQYCRAFHPDGASSKRRSAKRFLLRHNCDTGAQASGSAQLQAIDGRLTVVAIHTIGSPHGDGRRFDRQKNFNRSVPMAGDLLQTARDRLRRAPE